MLIPLGGDANITCSYIVHGIRPLYIMFFSNCATCITRVHEDRYTVDLVVTNFRTSDAGEARCVAAITSTHFATCYFNVTAAGEHDHYY